MAERQSALPPAAAAFAPPPAAWPGSGAGARATGMVQPAFLLVALCPPALVAWLLWLAPVGPVTADRTALASRDFAALWAAGRLALDGALGALPDPVLFTGALRSWFGAGIPGQIWPYPPTALLLAAPLSSPPLGSGFAIYTAGSVLALAWALRAGELSALSRLAILLSPAVAENALAGQNGALTTSLLVGGLLLADRRPGVAGLLLGALVIKPQLGLLLPICLAAAGRWRTILFAAASAAALVLASALLFGVAAWTDYLLRARPMITAYLEAPWQDTPSQRIFASAFVAARALGAGLTLAWTVQGAVTLGCAALAWRSWRRERDPMLRAAQTMALVMTASPWIHTYDMPALAVSVVVLLPRIRRRLHPTLALAWFWPGAVTLVPISPVVPFVSLCSVVWLAVGRWPAKPPTLAT